MLYTGRVTDGSFRTCRIFHQCKQHLPTLRQTSFGLNINHFRTQRSTFTAGQWLDGSPAKRVYMCVGGAMAQHCLMVQQSFINQTFKAQNDCLLTKVDKDGACKGTLKLMKSSINCHGASRCTRWILGGWCSSRQCCGTVGSNPKLLGRHAVWYENRQSVRCVTTGRKRWGAWE